MSIEFGFHNKAPFTVIFDAKYRNYNSQGITQFIHDIQSTAEAKYLHGIKGAIASFILP